MFNRFYNSPGENPNNNPKPKKPSGGGPDFKGPVKVPRTPLIWIGLVIVMLVLAQVFGTGGMQGEKKLTYTEFNNFLNENKIQNGVLEGNTLSGNFKIPYVEYVNGKEVEHLKYRVTILHLDTELLNQWDEAGLEYEFKEPTIGFKDILMNILPWIVIIGVWVVLMRRMSGNRSGQSGGGIFSFGNQNPGKKFNPENTKITFKDVAGCVEAKQELEEIIEFLKSPERFQRLGGRIPRGALLLGPPGTGKTLLAKAVAGEAKVPFYSISGADFVEMFVGVGASRVRGLFEQALKNSPAIVFIDEIDAVGRQRGAGLGGGHDEREQTLNQLLVQMDGFDSDASVIVIAATNRPDILDSALLRPGRFDRQVVVDVPDALGREGILKVHAKNIKLSSKVDLKTLAKGTPGMVGADLANLVNEAALLAARKNHKSVTTIDFEEAKDKIMMGTERKSMLLSEDDKKITAIHEAGHALVGLLLKDSDPIHKVSIIPRGRALGITHMLPEADKYNYSKKYIIAQLQVMMGGRVAEELTNEDITTGASNDIERATDMARRMVCEWGMSDALGVTAFGSKSNEIFIGRDFGTTKNYSEATAQKIDQEVQKIISMTYDKAKDLLKKYFSGLQLIADALLDKETLDREQLEKIAKDNNIEIKGS
ncbi:MAG: ATP-dependent zinc metalloprotease FtsH [Candidatus Marinimicrobia bacterium]|nr:ATP-dependent zinc metalloprotease FtsH [Candidatus Neomarinimicrobiota bacterium]